MPTPNTDTDPPEPMTVKERREVLQLVAVDGLSGLRAMGEIDDFELIDYCLRAIALELSYLSIKYEDEAEPAMSMAGAMLGGLFGIDTTEDDELFVKMHEQAKRLRERILA